MKSALILCAAFLMIVGCKTKSPLKMSPPTIEETYWKLSHLNEQPVSLPSGAKPVYLILNKEGTRVQGFSGCNGFGGTYELQPEGRIRFVGLVGTMMACDHLEIENRFLKALGDADSYSISGTTLTLNRARMVPLARFQPVKSIE